MDIFNKNGSLLIGGERGMAKELRIIIYSNPPAKRKAARHHSLPYPLKHPFLGVSGGV
jgi:hypothetical protein